MGRKCLSVRPGSWQKFKRFHFKFDVTERDGPILKNVKSVARLLHNSGIIRLHILTRSYLFGHRRLRGVQETYNTLPLYLDAFRQLGRVREARVTLKPDPPIWFKGIEERTKLASDKTEAMNVALRWRKYYEEWVEELERGRLVETQFAAESRTVLWRCVDYWKSLRTRGERKT
ncbi:hypothetical protein PRK78_001476 [Emydomyces testavorans]|uniref:Uncharacterized protein n=1 Tax=Emydomyces testavorans TaxID=2070801 RepID=A0AAF0DCJ7_9EURO|nr:hypothetical protein PRK78_001476 [Emydomyces testavorans]